MYYGVGFCGRLSDEVMWEPVSEWWRVNGGGAQGGHHDGGNCMYKGPEVRSWHIGRTEWWQRGYNREQKLKCLWESRTGNSLSTVFKFGSWLIVMRFHQKPRRKEKMRSGLHPGALTLVTAGSGRRRNPVRKSLEPSPGLLLCFVSVVAFFSFHCKAQDVLPPRSCPLHMCSITLGPRSASSPNICLWISFLWLEQRLNAWWRIFPSLFICFSPSKDLMVAVLLKLWFISLQPPSACLLNPNLHHHSSQGTQALKVHLLIARPKNFLNSLLPSYSKTPRPLAYAQPRFGRSSTKFC